MHAAVATHAMTFAAAAAVAGALFDSFSYFFALFSSFFFLLKVLLIV